jgi:hypothetical protein
MGSSSLPQSPPGAVSTSGGRSFFGRVAGFFGFFSAYVGNRLEQHQKKRPRTKGHLDGKVIYLQMACTLNIFTGHVNGISPLP